MEQERYSKERILHGMVRLYALMFLLIALFHYQFIADLLQSPPPFIPTTIYPIQIVGFLLFILCLFFEFALKKSSFVRSLFHKNTTLNGMLLILSILFPIISLEIILRPFAHFVHKDASMFQLSDRLGWIFKPNIRQQYDEILLETNRFGFRGPEISIPKPPHITRILFLGDSVTFGLRLEYRQTFPYQVGAILNRETDIRYETINAGIPGYSTWQEYLLYEQTLAQLQPDIVVLTFVLNDVLLTYTGLKYGDYGSDNPVPFIRNTWLDVLMQNSGVVYFARQFIHLARYRRTLHQDAVHREYLGTQTLIENPDHPALQEPWNLTIEYILKTYRKAESQNSRFLLVIMPTKEQLSDIEQTSAPQTRLLAFAREKQIQTIDMLRVLHRHAVGHNLDRDDYFMDSLHLKEFGCAITAEAIAGWINEQEL